MIPASPPASVKSEVEDFLLDNDLPAYFLGVSQDFKHWLRRVNAYSHEDGAKVVRLLRKEACYCRFAPADEDGRIPQILYANLRKCVCSRENIEVIELLDLDFPVARSATQARHAGKHRKFAFVSRVPTPDSTYYPFLTMPLFFAANGTTSSSLSASLRRS